MYEEMETEVLVKAIAHHTAEEKEHKATADAMKAVLRKRLGVTEEALNIGDFEVSIGENNRYNAKKGLSLVQTLPKTKQKELLVQTVDTKKFKALYPDLYAKAQDPGEHRVNIKEKED